VPPLVLATALCSCCEFLSCGFEERVGVLMCPQIRELLERGEVESVEQLLGRKYRLVADMAAATLLRSSSTSSCSGSVRDINSGSSNGSSSSSSSGSSCSGVDGTDAGGLVRVAVPCAAYQNQPPANGKYRALVQLVRGQQAPLGTAYAGDGGGDCTGTGAAVLLSGGACMTVELSDAGLHVDLDGSAVQGELNLCQEGLIMIDFDVCG
jgi:hypothetical protein